MAVTVIDTRAKCNTVVRDQICWTKYNTKVVSILLSCSYPGKDAKCDIMAGNGFL